MLAVTVDLVNARLTGQSSHGSAAEREAKTLFGTAIVIPPSGARLTETAGREASTAKRHVRHIVSNTITWISSFITIGDKGDAFETLQCFVTWPRVSSVAGPPFPIEVVYVQLNQDSRDRLAGLGWVEKS